MTNGIKIFIVIWLVFGLLAAGFINSSLHDGFKWTSYEKCKRFTSVDQSFSIIYGVVFGPFAFVASMVFTGFGYSGWTLYRSSCENGVGK